MKEFEIKRRPVIAYNNSQEPLFITTKWHTDPLGGPAKIETQNIVGPGQGIDLLTIGMDLIKK